MKLRRLIGVATVLLLGLVPLIAQSPLPNDPAVRIGTLPSGLKFFLLTSTLQPDRVLVQLSVKAGSIDEADDQRGVAHLLEHMAFNGSAHFKPGEMFSYFQSIGARVGAHINAVTSFDQTMYFMDVPAAQEAAVHRAFEALRDVADGLTLDETELARERRVVIEEWRRRLGVAQRQQQVLEASWFGGSRYADRPVIGDVDRLATMPVERVRSFYRDHYHPDQMALIVAGGLPAATIESVVHETFDTVRKVPTSPRVAPDGPHHSGTRYAAFTDPEVRNGTVGVMFVYPHPPVRTDEDLRTMMLQVIAGALMNERLATVARRPDAPFRAATAVPVRPLLNTEVASFSAVGADGNAPAALSALLEEIARAREHGFTQEELTPARAAASAAFLNAPRNNRMIVDALARHFLLDEPVPSSSQLTLAAQAVLPRVTNDEIRAAIRTNWSEPNRVITSSVPANTGTVPVTEAILRQTVAIGDRAATPPPWQRAAPVVARTTTLPPPGKVASRHDEQSGLTVLTLSNGVEVWLKPLPPGPGSATPSPLGAANVTLAVLARGGASLAPAAERVQAQLAGLFVAGAGVGGLTPEQRAQMLQGRRVTVQPFVTSNAHGLNVSTRSTDLDAALNQVHLYFTSPNEDGAAFERVKSAARARLESQASNPTAMLQLRVNEVNTSGFAPLRPQTLEEVATADPAAALRFYRERFSNAADFTFFVAGAFSVDAMTPLVEKYVGSLPSSGTARGVSGVGAPSFPSSVVRETIRKGSEPRSQVTLSFFAPGRGDAALEERAIAIASILRRRLNNRLRGVMGATYAVNVVWANGGPEHGM